MEYFEKTWGTIIHLGVTEDLALREARRVSYVNQTAVFSVLYVLLRIASSANDPH